MALFNGLHEAPSRYVRLERYAGLQALAGHCYPLAAGMTGPANRKGSKASTIKLTSHQPTLNYHEFNKEEDDPTYAHVSYLMDNGHHPRRPLIQLRLPTGVSEGW